jgi:hypothetical protein
VIAGVTIAASGAVALAFAPPLLPIERAAAWIARPAIQAMTRDPRAHDSIVISIENVPVAGTYCPIPARYGMTAVPGRDSGPSATAIPDTGAPWLVGESSRPPAPDSPAKCTPAPASAGGLR